MVPTYYRSRHGRVFRLQRIRERANGGQERLILRAIPIVVSPGNGSTRPLQVDVALDESELRGRLRNGLAVLTPEQVLEQLWQQLRLDLEAPPPGSPG